MAITEVVLRYGFMEEPAVARDLEQHLSVRPETTYYFLGRETVDVEGRLPMARWREILFAEGRQIWRRCPISRPCRTTTCGRSSSG